MRYTRCGRSGLHLPALSLGLWNNFGEAADPAFCREMVAAAADAGITHFDLANNYGPPPGSAETRFGELLAGEFAAHRDSWIIATKAGHPMWPGPYGDWGSRKHLLASLDQSLRRLRVPYVDIFYHHRPDPDTPLEETVGALVSAVRSGKALYVGLSKYPADRLAAACRLLADEGVPCLVHQLRYNLLERDFEHNGVRDAAETLDHGVVAFSPLAQGVLTNKYAAGVPTDSRAGRGNPFLTPERLTDAARARADALAGIARERGLTLTQLALAWTLRNPRVCSAIIGASRPDQIRENVAALDTPPLDAATLAAIDAAGETPKGLSR